MEEIKNNVEEDIIEEDICPICNSEMREIVKVINSLGVMLCKCSNCNYCKDLNTLKFNNNIIRKIDVIEQ